MKIKKIIAATLAVATAATMVVTASATIVTDKNDDGNFAYSSEYNSKAFGYQWNTATLQALYPEFTKSYLSTPRTYVSSRTHGNGMMVGMLDKSIKTWEDAKYYVKNLTIKDVNGKVLLCKVERDSATGRFGLRAFDINQVEYKISKTVVKSRVELTYTLKGLWVGAIPSVYVSNVTFTAGGECYFANGYNGFKEADWYTVYTFQSNDTLKTKTTKYNLGKAKSTEYQTLTFNAVLSKDGKTRNLTTTTHKNTTVEYKGYVGLEDYSLDGKCTEKVATYDFAEDDDFVLFKKSGSTLYLYYGNGNHLDYDITWKNASKILSVIKDRHGYGLKRSGDLEGITVVKCYAGSQIKSYNGEYYLDEGLDVGSFKPSEV